MKQKKTKKNEKNEKFHKLWPTDFPSRMQWKALTMMCEYASLCVSLWKESSFLRILMRVLVESWLSVLGFKKYMYTYTLATTFWFSTAQTAETLASLERSLRESLKDWFDVTTGFRVRRCDETGEFWWDAEMAPRVLGTFGGGTLWGRRRGRRQSSIESVERIERALEESVVYLDFVFVVIDVVEAQTDTWWKNVPSLLNLWACIPRDFFKPFRLDQMQRLVRVSVSRDHNQKSIDI